MACDYGLLWLIYGLLWGIVACYFRLLGIPGRSPTSAWEFWRVDAAVSAKLDQSWEVTRQRTAYPWPG